MAKKTKKTTDIKTTETLYSMNKNLNAHEPILTEKEIKNRLQEIMLPFVKEHQDKYFMLLCRERYDFTIFNYISKNNASVRQSLNDMYECLTNRGSVNSIDLTETKDALEIWITFTGVDSAVFFFFPYDLGVIEEYLVV